jgi:hypothetical protein
MYETTFPEVLRFPLGDGRKQMACSYYQFLATDGEWIFMKPKVMRRMADSLKISPEYKPEPNWRTYFKLKESADCAEKELQSRKLTPHTEKRALHRNPPRASEGPAGGSAAVSDCRKSSKVILRAPVTQLPSSSLLRYPTFVSLASAGLQMIPILYNIPHY